MSLGLGKLFFDVLWFLTSHHPRSPRLRSLPDILFLVAGLPWKVGANAITSSDP